MVRRLGKFEQFGWKLFPGNGFSHFPVFEKLLDPWRYFFCCGNMSQVVIVHIIGYISQYNRGTCVLSHGVDGSLFSPADKAAKREGGEAQGEQ
jgi:hypothetical protein